MNRNFRVNYTKGIYTSEAGGLDGRRWIIKVALCLHDGTQRQCSNMWEMHDGSYRVFLCNACKLELNTVKRQRETYMNILVFIGMASYFGFG